MCPVTTVESQSRHGTKVCLELEKQAAYSELAALLTRYWLVSTGRGAGWIPLIFFVRLVGEAAVMSQL